MEEPSERDLAYAAGIIDGEGTIGITEYAPGRERKSPQFRCYVAVAMTDARPLIWLAETFGGTVHSYPPRAQGHRGVTYWRLGNRRAAEFCALVGPFLKVKAEQAALLPAFYADGRLNHERRGGRGPQLPTDELAARREYVTKVRVLNRRGA